LISAAPRSPVSSWGAATFASASQWFGTAGRTASAIEGLRFLTIAPILAVDDRPNTFNGNAWNGFEVREDAQLVFEGGEAADNGDDGLRLDATSAQPPLVHDVSALTATANPNHGVAVFGGSLRLRTSTLLQNGTTGLFFVFHDSTTLDFGAQGDPGNNTFGGITTTNAAAGMLLCADLGLTVTQPAEGNEWSTCPPLQYNVGDCTSQWTEPKDIVTAGTGITVQAPTSCSTGL
jgi:hypothetical protein